VVSIFGEKRELIMCLVVLAIDQHPKHKLILAANRDEYYDRPSAPPAFWEEAPQVLAGKDLKGGGTWLGITKTGRIAAITNYRDPASVMTDAPSRGWLVRDYLLGMDEPASYLKKVRKDGIRYNGFNLIVGHKEKLFWYSNRGEGIISLSPGLHGISNRLLNTPWPKVTRSKERLADLLANHENPPSEGLFKLLRDRSIAPDDVLPDTGVGIEWERILSSVYITSPTYGTRSSTLILLDLNDRVTFMDRTFDSRPEPTASVQFEFTLE
jgi:uncharacterized protein with NRDE domain